MKLVNALWRRNRGLQILNATATCVAMAVIFELSRSVITQSDPDGETPVMMIAICLVCSAMVTKCICDFAYLAQWVPLQKLRLTGASPIRLLCALSGVQALLSLVSAVFGVALGLALDPVMQWLFIGMDVVLPQTSLYSVTASACLTFVVSVFCGVAGAASAGLKIILAPPDPSMTQGATKRHRSRRGWPTLALAVVIAGSAYTLYRRPFNGSTSMFALVLPILFGWMLIRVADPLLFRCANLTLTAIHGGSGRRSIGGVTVWRDVLATRSFPLASLVTVAVILVGTLYTLYGYQDTAAARSITAVLGSNRIMTANTDMNHSNDESRHNTRLAEFATRMQSDAVVFAPISVAVRDSSYRSCARQMKDDTYPWGKVVTSGEFGKAIRPQAVDGALDDPSGGVVATSVSLDPQTGERSRIGAPVCVVTPSGVRQMHITAVADMPGTLGNLIVIPPHMSDASANKRSQSSSTAWMSAYRGDADIAILPQRPHHSERAVSRISRKSGSGGFVIQSVSQWVGSLRSGQINAQGGSNGTAEAAPIVYPVLLICMFGGLSVVFTMASERKRRAQASWLLDMGCVRYALAGAGRVVMEILPLAVIGSFGSVLLVNAVMAPSARALYGSIIGFVPWSQLGIVAAALVALAVAAFVANVLAYRDSSA